jgi:RNA polymerase sigma factor (sigma-70 family)
MSSFLRRLTRGMAAESSREQPDRQLVERLLAGPDEAAFEVVVRRHGPMVYRVCWRVLRQEQDTEDAFQATFLILARQLHTVRKHGSLASWLHGVAHRVALKTRAQAATRCRCERQAGAETFPREGTTWRELRLALDAELQRLPENWRLPLILCYLEGQTQDEAARQLGWSERTLRRRLEEARAALGRRLTGRGVVWTAALSAVLLSDCVAPAALAPGLVGPTVEAAASIAAGQAARAAVSAKVTALTEGVLKTMFARKLKIAAAALVLLAAVAVGAGGLLRQTQAAEPQQPPQGYSKSEPVKVPAGVPAARGGDKPQAARRPIIVKEDAYLSHLAWSTDGKIVATVGVTFDVVEVTDSNGNNPQKVSVPQGTIKLWDARTGKLQRTLGQEQHTRVHSLAFSPDKETVALVATGRLLERAPDVIVRLMDAKTWRVRHKVEDVSFGGVLSFNHAAFSPDGKRLALGGYQNGYSVKLWDVQNQKLIGGTKSREGQVVADPNQAVPDPVWKTAVTCLAFSPDGKWFAAGDRDGKVRLFDGRSGEAKGVLEDHSESVGGVAFSADAKKVFSASVDRTVKIWDVAKGKLLRTLEGHKGAISMTAALSPDGKLLATAGSFAEKKGDPWQTEVILWDARTGDRKRTITDLAGPVLSLAFSPDGRTLAAAGGYVLEGAKATGEMRLIPLE